MKIPQSHIVKVTVLSVIIFGIIQVLNWLFGNPIALNVRLLIDFGYTILYTFSIFLANSFMFQFLDRVFAKDRFSKKRLLIGFLSSFGVSVLVIFMLRLCIDVFINHITIQQFMANERASNYVFSLVITFFIAISFYAFYFYKS